MTWLDVHRRMPVTAGSYSQLKLVCEQQKKKFFISILIDWVELQLMRQDHQKCCLDLRFDQNFRWIISHKRPLCGHFLANLNKFNFKANQCQIQEKNIYEMTKLESNVHAVHILWLSWKILKIILLKQNTTIC